MPKKSAVCCEEGKGTIFKVYLPAVKRASSIPAEMPSYTVPTGSERILFVDDEPALAKMGKQLLESLGYSVTACSSSIAALELFASHPEEFDLVISDMTMPCMDGVKLISALKKIRKQLPAILSTGFNPNIDENQSRDIGIDAFVNKPLLKNKLAETVRHVLDGQNN